MNEASSPLPENSHSSFTHNPDRKAAWTCCKASFYSGCTKNLVRFRLTLMAWHIQMRPIMPLKSKGPCCVFLYHMQPFFLYLGRSISAHFRPQTDIAVWWKAPNSCGIHFPASGRQMVFQHVLQELWLLSHLNQSA